MHDKIIGTPSLVPTLFGLSHVQPPAHSPVRDMAMYGTKLPFSQTLFPNSHYSEIASVRLINFHTM